MARIDEIDTSDQVRVLSAEDQRILTSAYAKRLRSEDLSQDEKRVLDAWESPFPSKTVGEG